MLVLHQLALLAALAAVGVTAVRAAAALGARGLELPVAAAALGTALAGLTTLALGLVGLSGSSLALLATALLAAVVAVRRWPPAHDELGDWWRRRSRNERWLVGAIAGAGATYVAWLLRNPSLGIDPLTYHLPESIRWVQQGTAGSVERFLHEFPQGNYPVTNELLVSWLLGLAHTPVPALLWTPATALLAGASGWLALSRLHVPPVAAAFALAAVLLTPIALGQLVGPHTDLPAMAWLYATVALVLAAEREPRLLLAAIVAAGLTLGTKTTPAPLVVPLVAYAIWRHGLRREVFAGALVAVAIGGVWYLRNWIDHGSPLWPFVALPGGDPIPPVFERLDTSFLGNAGPTLELNRRAYVDGLAGGLVLLAAGLLAPLARPARPVLIASAATLLALLAWLNAPFTGFSGDGISDVSASTVRYLLPALSAAAVAVALTRRTWLIAIVTMATAWSLVVAPARPHLMVLALGALVGVALARRRLPGLVPVAAVASLAVLVVAADGFAERQSRATWLRSHALVAWAAAHPDFDEEFPIATSPDTYAPLAGDRLQHEIELIPRDESCADIARRIARGWVVLETFAPVVAARRTPTTATECLRTAPPGTRVIFEHGGYRVFARG